VDGACPSACQWSTSACRSAVVIAVSFRAPSSGRMRSVSAKRYPRRVEGLNRRPERLRISPFSALSSQVVATSRSVRPFGARSFPMSSERFASARHDFASDSRGKYAHKLRSHVRSRSPGGTQISHRFGHGLFEGRTVRLAAIDSAEEVRQAILEWSADQAFAGKLWLSKIRIDGDLDLEMSEIGMRIIFDHCEIPGSISLREAVTKDVTFFCSQVTGSLTAPQLRAKSNIRVIHTSIRGGLSLIDANIDGQLVLNGSTLGSATGDVVSPALEAGGARVGSGIVCIDGFTAHGQVGLAGATIGGYLDLTGASLYGAAGSDGVITALRADGIEIAGAMACRHPFKAVGVVRLPGARVGGMVSMVGAVIEGKLDEDQEVTALHADGMEISGSLICRGLNARGIVRLPGARIRDQISMDQSKIEGTILLSSAVVGQELGLSNVQLDGCGDPALLADRIHVGQGAFLDKGFSSVGEVSFVDAKIDLTFGFGSASLKSNGETYALNARGVEVAGDIECAAGFSATGKVRFDYAKVEGKISLVDASFRTDRSHECALSLRYVTAREIAMRLSDVCGPIDMSQAAVSCIYDAEGGRLMGKYPDQFLLDGLTYAVLQEPLDAERRLAWIRPSQAFHYYPEVYVELANAFRRVGRSGDARKVLIAGERRAQRELKRFSPRRLWSNFLWLTVGYGYRNGLALVWLIGLILSGTLVFAIGEDHFLSMHVNGPAFDPGLMAIDATVPVLDTAQGDAWVATGAMAWVTIFLSLSGYALATAAIAAAASILNRE
jgi:hypothetical protein